MDFMKTFDARGAAETPVELELRNPATGEAITSDGKPCIVMIRGAASRSVQDGLRQEATERARKAKGKDGKTDTDPQMVSDLHDSACRSASRLITGFRNMQTADGKGARALTLDDVPAFLDLTFFSMAHALRKPDDETWHGPSFAQQIIDAATDDARFLARSATA